MARIRGVLIEGIIYILVVVAICFVLLISYFSSLTFINVLLLIIGTVLGVVASYSLMHSFEHEKTIKFFPGEELILKSSGNGSYVLFKHIGDKVFEYDPMKADIYLTNMGIIAEIPESGQMMLYIPHDRVIEYVTYEAGILVRYLDTANQFAESVIYVEDRSAWINSMQTMYATLSKKL